MEKVQRKTNSIKKKRRKKKYFEKTYEVLEILKY
jgi:hypothetical protein